MTQAPRALVAALADHYTIEKELGRGGMATVYLARDFKHEREVAIKVLHSEFAATLGAERFLREIKIAARLNHPHILSLHDSGEAAGFLFYVMPFAEGESLRDRLLREKQLPVEEALRIARDVADALSYAHAHDVVHRDIKPENILLDAGHAMVADFGIARAIRAAGSDHITLTGMSVGTPAYMSPEQAAGNSDVDGRSDQYALACVLYEMLAGQPPFTGVTAESIVRQHMIADPPNITRIRPSVPIEVATGLSRALSKSPADRFNPVSQFADALARRDSPPTFAGYETRRYTSRQTPRIAIACLAAMAVGIAAWRMFAVESPVQLDDPLRLTNEPGLEVHPAISPDGRSVAYAAGTSTRMHIFIRDIAGGNARRLTNDTVAIEEQPRWSPRDSSTILYLAHGSVFVAPSGGGTPRQIIPIASGDTIRSAAWSPDGNAIAFVKGDSLFIKAFPGDGTARLVGSAPFIHSCAWAPSNRWVACVSGSGSTVMAGTHYGNLALSHIVVLPLGGGPAVTVTDSSADYQSPAWLSSNDELIFAINRRGASDLYSGFISATGSMKRPASRLSTGLQAQSVSISDDGRHAAYSVYASASNVWALPIPAIPPRPAANATQITFGSQSVEGMNVSRDGRWLIYDSDKNGNGDIYRVALASAVGEPERLTMDTIPEFAPDISPDQRHMTYHIIRGNTRMVIVASFDGQSSKVVSGSTSNESYPQWSPDGNTISFHDQGKGAPMFLARQTSGGWSAPIERAKNFRRTAWSPDGKRIVGIRQPGSVVVVSVISGDTSPVNVIYTPRAGSDDPRAASSRFSSDGKTIYFKCLDNQRTSFWSIPASGGTPRLILHFDDPGFQSNRQDWTLDSSRFYFPVQSRESDVWIVNLSRK